MEEELQPVSLFWFRRDLRTDDNRGLYHALSSGNPVLPVFILDTEILGKLEDKDDRRVTFILSALEALNMKLAAAGSSLNIFHGTPEEAFRRLIDRFAVKEVYTNGDYEPYATARDLRIASMLEAEGIAFHSFKDQVVFEKGEVVKPDGRPYTVFTPYSRAWKRQLTASDLKVFHSEELAGNYLKQSPSRIPEAVELGFRSTGQVSPFPIINTDIIRNYNLTRDFPSIEGTTRLGVHLRFGTVSIRRLVSIAIDLNETWLNELIWREFFMSILWHFPHVTDVSFKSGYDALSWRNNEEEFGRWCNGLTGYPIIDAGMRQLNNTGFMHNRVRMITAGFLAKHLLIDWRWGEAYFAAKLLDYELSSNNGNWQWAAGTGCDAAPYFRVFNPGEQARKYDPDLAYVRRWVAELGTPSYPEPVVDHVTARRRAVEAYKAIRR
jgi:deoxyribodipyrimidine photo-lyase